MKRKHLYVGSVYDVQLEQDIWEATWRGDLETVQDLMRVPTTVEMKHYYRRVVENLLYDRFMAGAMVMKEEAK